MISGLKKNRPSPSILPTSPKIAASRDRGSRLASPEKKLYRAGGFCAMLAQPQTEMIGRDSGIGPPYQPLAHSSRRIGA